MPDTCIETDILDSAPTKKAGRTASRKTDVKAAEPETAQWPPAGHRWERFDVIRPTDGKKLRVVRDIETGEQQISEIG